MSERIYLSPPDMSAAEREALLAAFDSNWIAPLGPEVDAFERDLAARVGVQDAAALSSGTAALHLALILLEVGPGDEVWTATLTFAATANAIRYVGATPVFIDSERESWNLDPALLREALRDASARGALPKALVVVDLYGQCADYDPILAACQEYGVPVIEDAAEALGATYRGKPAGSFGAIGVLSFNGNKIMTTSGGGALVSDDSALVERARHLASQARQPAAHYEHEEVGYNYRLSNLLAAVGRAQLARLDGFVERRREINRRYRDALEGIEGIAFLPEAPGRSLDLLADLRIARRRPSGGRARTGSRAPRDPTTSKHAPSGSRCICSPCIEAVVRLAAESRKICFGAGFACPAVRSFLSRDKDV